ncbi:ABC transporter permease [Carboxydochorda subterranea]|uniref:ABC transporter permease n=1 Tax=Carboxydichorda subterranea TaxID=3109565 RepID=A0ABZ1BX48_9FIRM|nr:ABC transporter permease [Limnochorda sp. L945t]WRP17273.1 ABC transporter permease [Limnochorda sp. L945t]
MMDRTAKVEDVSPARRAVAGIRMQEVGILAILLVMSALLAIRAPQFLTSTNIFNVLRAFSWIAIAAFGEALVIITAGIDLSVGSVMAVAGLASAMMLTAGHSTTLAVVAGLLTGLFVGAVNGALISWGRLAPFIATLGTMSIARGFAYGLTGGWPVRGLPASFNFLGQYDLPVGPWKVPLPVIFMLLLAVMAHFFLNRSVWGYRIYAVGGNEQASALAGVNVRRIKLLVYSLSGLLAGVGGILMTARLGVAAPTAGLGYELDVIAAAVIGGTSLMGGEGTILGVLIGAAIMQVIRNGLVLMGFPAYWQPAAIGAVIIVAIMIDQLRRR